ncbi:MAG: hypothetical protein KC620_16710 [Myxococcales bacterium]|nr:hypothetical protein [Myxococcales bacterium]
MSREQAAKMSTETVGLAGALAEWSGGQKSAAEVSDILTKAYLGETDGLKALGISISAADVSARLAAKGQDELTGSALEQARALAIQELVFEKSTDAQKRFADGADSAARKQAEMRASINEAKEALAMALAPALAAVVTKMAEFVPIVISIASTIGSRLVPAARAFGGIIGDLAPHLATVATEIAEKLTPFLLPLAGFIGGVAAVIIGSMVPAVITWTAAEIAKATALLASAAAFIAANAPMIAIAAAVGLLVAGVVLLIQNWDTITAKVPLLGVAFDAVKVVMEAFLTFITGPFKDGVLQVPTIVEDAFNTALNFVKDNFGFLWDPYIKAPLEAIKLGVESQLDTVKNLFETAFGVIRGIFDVFAGLFTGDWDRMKEGLLQIGTSLKDGFVEQMRIMIDLVKGLGGLAWDAMKAVGDNLMDGLKAALGNTAGFAGDVAQAVLAAVKSIVNDYVIGPINRTLEFTIPVPGPLPDIHINPPDIPYLARGGIVMKPTLAVVGEAGPEAVIPLSKMRAGMGGGINVHIHGDVYARDEAEARRSAGWLGYGLAQSLRARGAA